MIVCSNVLIETKDRASKVEIAVYCLAYCSSASDRFVGVGGVCPPDIRWAVDISIGSAGPFFVGAASQCCSTKAVSSVDDEVCTEGCVCGIAVCLPKASMIQFTWNVLLGP